MLIVVVSGVVLISTITASRDTLTTGSDRGIPKGTPLVRSRTPLTLDLFWTEPLGYGPGANVSVNLSNGAVHTSPEALAVFGLARQGYILGATNTETVSMSYDLRHTLYTWTGKYGNNPVPANNPSDIWVSSGNGATELNQYERPVAPTVAIPVSRCRGTGGPQSRGHWATANAAAGAVESITTEGSGDFRCSGIFGCCSNGDSRTTSCGQIATRCTSMEPMA